LIIIILSVDEKSRWKNGFMVIRDAMIMRILLFADQALETWNGWFGGRCSNADREDLTAISRDTRFAASFSTINRGPVTASVRFWSNE
jgi:hypothetical protein